MANLHRALILIISMVCLVKGGEPPFIRDNPVNVLLYGLQYFGDLESFKNGVEKIGKKICPSEEKKIAEALDLSTDCIRAVDWHDTFCDATKTAKDACLGTLVKTFEDCVPSESKEIPKLIIDSFFSLVDYSCKIDGKHIFELIKTYYVGAKRPHNYTCEYPVVEDYGKIKENFTSAEPNLPTKSQVCTLATQAQTCMKNFMERTLKNEVTRDAILGYMTALLAPCTPSNNEDNPLNKRRIIDFDYD